MSDKKLSIRIYPDGKIEAKTINIKGKKCNEILNLIEEIIPAKIVDSSYTNEYQENEVTLVEKITGQNIIKDVD